jgi:DNA-binding PadR family transcriptional regulator
VATYRHALYCPGGSIVARSYSREVELGPLAMPIAPTDRGFLILTSLASGPKHGYGLMQDIESFAGVSLGPGTLYGALSRLEQEGLVAPLPSTDRRRPYELTAAGSRVLQTQLSENARLIGIGLSRLASARP